VQEEERVTEPTEIDLYSIEFDEDGRAIIANEAFIQAVRDAQERAKVTNEGYENLAFIVHSW
jgi:RNA processing factor Prp31